MKQLKLDIKRGIKDTDQDNPFDLFISSTDIKYVYYKDSEKILGNTYGMCVLQVSFIYLFIYLFIIIIIIVIIMNNIFILLFINYLYQISNYILKSNNHYNYYSIFYYLGF